jgi:hypothetical protein
MPYNALARSSSAASRASRMTARPWQRPASVRVHPLFYNHFLLLTRTNDPIAVANGAYLFNVIFFLGGW